MVKTYYKFADIQSGATKVKESITKNLPDWKWFDAMAGSLFVKILWSLFYVWFYYMFATEWDVAVVPAHIVMALYMVLLSIGLLISLATPTTKWKIPKPCLLISLCWGRLSQPHAEGGKANFARKWYEIDPIYPIIRVLDWVGLIKINPVALRA